MKNSILINWAIPCLIALLISVQPASSLGIAPSSSELIFEQGTSKEIKLKIFNTEKKTFKALVYAEGPLEKYITIPESTISFQGEETKIISYTINFSKNIDTQGPVNTNIIIRQIQEGSTESGATMQASIAVVSKLKVTIPYTGKFAEARLFAGYFKQNEDSNFSIEIKNLGTEDLNSVKAAIDIIDPLNNKIMTIIGEETQIASKQTKIISVKWVPKLGAGTYKAIATILYDGKSVTDEKGFTIGEPTLEVSSISVKNFTLGGIAKFDIFLQSNWNQKIEDIFAQVEVKDETGKIFVQYKTPTIYTEPLGKQTLEAYWNTQNVLAGKYKLDISLFYMGKAALNTFNIYVSTNEIKTTPLGQVISEETKEQSTIIRALYFYAILVIILIIFNAHMYFKKLNDK